MKTLIYISCLIGSFILAKCDDECPEYDCPAKDGSFADPCTCRRYYQCIDFLPIRSHCPSGLYWDDIKKFCTYKNEAVCGPVATTPAPPSTTPPPDMAKKCREEDCQLPWCFCSSDGTQIPGGLTLEETPQMILFMLDGAINQNNYRSYKRVFRNRTNPNGCNILGTFFLTHNYGNYYHVESLRHDGHEMAVSSISDDSGLYLKNYTAWTNEIVGMRRIMELQAGILEDEVLGVRAPGLKPGYNAQYDVLIDYGFIWDSSMGVPPLNKPIWPYTLDYAIPHECKTKTCPTRQFPGVWEIPLNSHHVEGFIAGHCPYLDQCVFTHMDKEDIFEWLKEDFLRHYETNRAPYTMAMHTNWFTTSEQRDALIEFMDWVQTKDGVYFVTATQALLWMTDPVPVSKLNSFEAWECREDDLPPKPCKSPNKCSLAHRETGGVNTVRYMTTCQSCPNIYPWLANTRGRDTEEVDVYEKYQDE